MAFWESRVGHFQTLVYMSIEVHFLQVLEEIVSNIFIKTYNVTAIKVWLCNYISSIIKEINFWPNLPWLFFSKNYVTVGTWCKLGVLTSGNFHGSSHFEPKIFERCSSRAVFEPKIFEQFLSRAIFEQKNFERFWSRVTFERLFFRACSSNARAIKNFWQVSLTWSVHKSPKT